MCKLQSLEEKWTFFDISVPYYLKLTILSLIEVAHAVF